MVSKVFFLLNLAIIPIVIAVSPIEKCRGDGWTVVSEYSEKPICVKAFITDNDLTYDEAATMCTKEEAQPAPMQNNEQKNAIKAAVEKEFRTNTRLTKSRYQIYLGAYHSAVPVGSHGKLYLIWDRTEVAGYTNWDEGQPDIEAFDKNQHEDCLMFPWSRASGGTAKWHDTACDCKKENKCIARTGGIVCAKWANDERKPPVEPIFPIEKKNTTTTTTTTQPTVIDEDDKVFEEPVDEYKEFPCDKVSMCPTVRTKALKLLDDMAKNLPYKLPSERKEFLKNDFLSYVNVHWSCKNNLGPQEMESKENDEILGRVGCMLQDWVQFKSVSAFERRGRNYEISFQLSGQSIGLGVNAYSAVMITFNEDYKVRDFAYDLFVFDCDTMSLCSI